MIIQTQSLTARALDWAVGVAVGKHVEPFLFAGGYIVVDNSYDTYSPTTNWGQLGPLIAEHVNSFVSGRFSGRGAYSVSTGSNMTISEGPTLEIAACRAIVAAKLGDQVDVPEVLCQ